MQGQATRLSPDAAATRPAPASTSHLVLIPSFDSGEKLLETVRAARAQWAPVWVIIDGSTDGSAERVEALARQDPQLEVLRLARNQGKGSALLHGLDRAAQAGFTHALTMDADGQHPAHLVGDFMRRSMRAPDAMILGVPRFDASAPIERVLGRRFSNFLVRLETRRGAVEDSLFGFRVYPIAPLREIMHATRHMRRYDFDAEAAVRLSWRDVPAVNVPAPVRYFTREQGGVSHFRYGRDNLLLMAMHLRLLTDMLARWLARTEASEKVKK